VRHVFGFLCLCTLALLLLACGGKSAGREDCGSAWSYDCACRASLDDYCKGSPCPTLVQAAAEAKKFAQDNCYDEYGCFSPEAGAGRCGEFRYVYTSCGEGYVTSQYFDASGTLVAVGICSDDGSEFSCGRSTGCKLYGSLPDCEREPTEDFCE
jgi:hypothetical protein